MANESVNPRMIPGLDDLLSYGFGERFDDPARVAQAADNVMLPLVKGVQAVGTLLARAANSTDPLDQDTIEDTGWLLKALGEMISAFQAIKSNGNYQAFDVRADYTRELLPAEH